MSVESHPLRITERDVLKEVSLEDWFSSFKGLDLHIRVQCARDLPAETRVGLPDPYCKIICGPAIHRTATQRRTLDPDWGEEFYVEWNEVSAAKRQLAVEVWAWDFWRPDELLGRGFIDIAALAFEPLEVLELDLQLYPGNVRKLKDIKTPKQQHQQQKKQQNSSKQRQDGDTNNPQQHSSLQKALSVQLLSTLTSAPSFKHYLQPHDAESSHNQHTKSPQKSKEDAAAALASSKHMYPELGIVRVALWWAPTWRNHAFDVAEKVSFCLLPGEIKVPPVVTHTKLGTLYEEPCIVYLKVSLLEVQLGSSWYLEYLQQANKSRPHARLLHRNVSESWSDVNSGGLDMDDSLEAAVAAVVRSYTSREANPGESQTGLLDFLSGSGSKDDPAEDLRIQQQQQQLLQQHLAAEPVYALARLRFGKNQYAESNPVRLRPGGAAVFREQFVFITKRPLQHKQLVLEVVLKGKALPGGNLIAKGEWSMVNLLVSSPPLPTTWLGVHAARRNQLPGIMLPLQGIEGGRVELLASAADADGRAAMYGVPPLSLSAATAAEAEAAAAPEGSSLSVPGSPRPPGSPAPGVAGSTSNSGITAEAVGKKLSLLTAAGAAAAAAAGKRGALGGAAAAAVAVGGSSQANGWLGWLTEKLPLGGNRKPRTTTDPIIPPAANPVRKRKPSPFATGTKVASAAVEGLGVMATSTPQAAAAFAAASAVAGPGSGDVDGDVPSDASPIPGLPIGPEAGSLSGPLATLQLVLHRVELTPEPPKGWWVVMKAGPHWAKSTVRRDSEFAWQLSMPIYHPTTTLVLVVFADAGRGKVEFIGKLHYRISHLMYLNHREVIKSLKLRATGSGEAKHDSHSQGPADSPHPPVVAPGTSPSQVTGTVLLGFTCSIPDRQRLLNAYERSQYPPTVHRISLFHAAPRDFIVQSHHQKVVAWLSDTADPPIPPAAAWKVLETGREKFKLSRSRHNIQRLKAATSFVPMAAKYFSELKEWKRPIHNIMSVAVMAAVCFKPIVTLVVFLLWRSVVALRRLLMHGLVEYLGFDLGELFDAAGIPSDLLLYDDEEDDDAASVSSGGSNVSSVYGPAAAASGAAGGGGWGGGGGGVRDMAAVMMFQPKRFKMLKKRYDQLLKLALQVQNRIDDCAMVLERLEAMVTGQDPLATALFFWRMLMLAAAMWLAGLQRLLFAWWCWEVLRPPSWRSPPGVKGPKQFVTNLPSRSLEDL